MRFAQPQWLWLLLVLPPALILFFWWSERQRERLMAQFIQARLLPGLTVGVSRVARRLRSVTMVMAVIFLTLTLARPQWGFTWEEAHMRGLDIAVAVDVSKSMLAEDVPPNRLARAKLAVMDLVKQALADRLALIAFAGTAFLQCPLTFDDAAFLQTLQVLDVGTIPQGGTAIGEAIDTALTAFKEGDNFKVLVLLTDGEDLEGGATDAAEKAGKQGLRIYTIGIGTPEGDLLRVKTAQNASDYVRDEQGNVVKSHLNEDLLREIAGKTEGGFYLPLRGAKTMETLYDQALSKLPKTERQERLTKRYHERFQWPLGMAILLLMIEMFVEGFRRAERAGAQSEIRKRKSESAAETEARAPNAVGAAGQVALLVTTLILMGIGHAQGSSARALKEYQQGDYGRSLADYEQLLKKNPDDPKLHYNAGVAAYRSGNYDAAAQHFSKALSSPDLNLQESAYYNRGNSSFYRGEQEPDPNKRKENWKKALQDFQSSLKLNGQDGDAKHNADYVKQRLEELQQQQQQQQQDQNKDRQDQDQQQQQQQQQQQNSQQKDQQQQSQQQQQQSKPEQQNQAQQQQQQQEQQEQQAQQEQQSQQQQQQEQQQAQQKKEEQSQAAGEQDKDKQEQAGAAGQQQQMSQEEAKRLLDAQKENEKLLPSGLNNKGSSQNRPFKDW